MMSGRENQAMAMAGLFGVAVTLLFAVMAAFPRPGVPVAVFANPWASSPVVYQVIATADARIVSSGSVPWVAVATDHTQPADLAARLYAAGAFFVADAAFVSACTRLIRYSGNIRS